VLFCSNKLSATDEIEKQTKEIFGNIAENKFTYHEPTYFIFGEDDLKLQFSGKYRIAKSLNLYFGYTQIMFWSIYTTSQPFTDINYHPEIFYRFVDNEMKFLKSLDFGFIHSSNGKDGLDSRSLNRVFLKTNWATKISRHSLVGDFNFYSIVSDEKNNRDIKNYMGFWDFTLTLTHLLTHGKDRLDFEVRTFAGKKVFNINKGGKSFGLIYHIDSENFNPEVYLQYYTGYGESLLRYNKTSDQVRLGLMIFI
jgi:phospholipase A1